MSQLWGVTCHMGSHSVTCHPTQVSTPCLNPSHTVRYSIYTYPRGRKAELTQVTCYILRWFTRTQAVTHPSTNRVQCRLTTLIEANALTTTLRSQPLHRHVTHVALYCHLYDVMQLFYDRHSYHLVSHTSLVVVLSPLCRHVADTLLEFVTLCRHLSCGFASVCVDNVTTFVTLCQFVSIFVTVLLSCNNILTEFVTLVAAQLQLCSNDDCCVDKQGERPNVRKDRGIEDVVNI